MAPCDGPPPEPGITTVGPSTRVPSNGSVAPIATGRAVARRTIEALRTFRPDVLHLHEPLSPGPNHAALVGTTIPAVGTFHSARTGRNGWYETFRPGLKPMMRRLAVATAVSEDAKRQVSLTFGTECEILPNGVDVAVVRGRAASRRRTRRRSSSSDATSAARASRCCSTRSRASSATRSCG